MPSTLEYGRSTAPITVGMPMARARIATCELPEPSTETRPTRRPSGTSPSIAGDSLADDDGLFRVGQVLLALFLEVGEQAATYVLDVGGALAEIGVVHQPKRCTCSITTWRRAPWAHWPVRMMRLTSLPMEASSSIIR